MVAFNRLLLLTVLGGVLWLSLLPQASAPTGLSWDKLNHALGFFFFMLLSQRAFPAADLLRWHAPGLLLYGLLMELLQGWLTTDRSLSLLDMVANGVGIAAYLLLAPRLMGVAWLHWLLPGKQR